MKRYILFVLLTICTLNAFAQSSMTDTQVMEFVQKEHKRGTSQAQIVTKLMQSGVDISQIRRVRDTYEKMQKGNAAFGATTEKTAADRSRTNNGQLHPGKSRRQIADATLDSYNTEEQEVNRYSDGRVSANRSWTNTYDENDGEYLKMQEEMNAWMPQDTATMYNNLLKQLSRNRKKVWGRDIFNNKSLSFEPNMNMALPRNYRIGPGDAVFIDVYGASQKSYQTTVAPDGIITLDGFGPIQVSGLTVAQANSRIREKLGRRYSSSSIRLSVGQTHTIMVNVVGEVKTPGTYTLSAFATVFNALYMAGGIGELGTLRNIKVYRGGSLISTVDVYDFLRRGHLTGNVRLADNDVIVVGPYEMLAQVSGKVKRPMFYEMKRGESLGTLISYAGGFAGDAYTRSVRVRRKTGRQYSIFNVNEFDMRSFRVSDEDSVSVDSVIPRYENMVEVKGAVFRPGMYEVGGRINSVRGLIEAADGLTEAAFSPHAVLHRKKADRTLEVISVDVDGILTGRVADIPLQNEDVLFIPTKTEVQEQQTITIHGEVLYPGVYKYADNESLEDFILQAGGLKQTASTVRVDVSRRISNPQALAPDSVIARTYSFSLRDGFVIDGAPGFVLEPFDEVYVRKSPGTNVQQNVSIEGEVVFAGNYTLTSRRMRLSDIFKAAGGGTELAYIKGARLERRPTPSERLRMEAAYKMQQEQQRKNMIDLAVKTKNATIVQAVQENDKKTQEKFQVPDSYPVGIELDKAIANPGGDEDVLLREGDRIIVPQYNGTVKINGAVMYPNTVGYVEGKSVAYYIDQAGGFASDAKKSNTYILYMNGMLAKVGHNAKVRPGCEIIVPTKIQSRMSLAETLSVGSSAASIAAVIATIASLLK
ncbi:SLBB domain-containing protein [Prevotella multiformis]|uniref:Polysaccharide biosynthesis/export protein n=1 Tax=Prevotella multiformis DSM 16608 TaxID=888743 RepID=F0F8D7_9BACT|nr:SLBB domain-containing protein [Prevotella multiformis]EGC19596.1 polysaccharide biosynthesis/export protein [Prevotella multiformis DSM 16608]QUB71714.1 SLBB domain-containing protein [Prevotella multiformis]